MANDHDGLFISETRGKTVKEDLRDYYVSFAWPTESGRQSDDLDDDDDRLKKCETASISLRNITTGRAGIERARGGGGGGGISCHVQLNKDPSFECFFRNRRLSEEVEIFCEDLRMLII